MADNEDNKTAQPSPQPPEVKEVEIKSEESAWQARDRIEREIQLKGRENPDTFQMPGGGTLAETRERLFKEQRAEGEAEAKLRSDNLRKQSMEGDPLYAGEQKVLADNLGDMRIVEQPGEAAPAPAQAPRMGAGANQQRITPPAGTPANTGSGENQSTTSQE
jgi:hypothetical protein